MDISRKNHETINHKNIFVCFGCEANCAIVPSIVPPLYFAIVKMPTKGHGTFLFSVSTIWRNPFGILLITLFQLILHQSEFRLLCQINQKIVITIQNWFDLLRSETNFSVCVAHIYIYMYISVIYIYIYQSIHKTCI